MIATLIANGYDAGLQAKTSLFALDTPVRVGSLDVSYVLVAMGLDGQGRSETTIYPADAQGNRLGSRALTISGKRDVKDMLQRFGLEVRGFGGVAINLTGGS